MWSFQLLVLLVRALYSMAAESADELAFPPDFKFGVATAAYQVEGAWNVSDKAESIWDRITHTHQDYTRSQTTGDVACDSYHNWRRDIEMLVELGVHFYRFSISWPRLLPGGITDNISEDGKKYYNDLIDGLLAKGIEPVVTLYHWDLPQRLHNLGGWTNPLVSDWFAHYARVVFSLYGDRVNTWITVNEPIIFCDMAYALDGFAPDFVDIDQAPYLCNKHALLAHAKAYRIYDQEFRKMYNYSGRISLSSQLLWMDPLKQEYEPLAELTRMNMVRSSHPVFSKEGGWPPSVEKAIAENSRKLGYPQSVLPPFSQEEIELIKGTYDFYALNYYTSRLVRPARPGEGFKPWPLEDCRDMNVIVEYVPTWNRTAAGWLYVNPEGLRKQLAWLKKQYGDLNILIMENGFASQKGLNDIGRITYYKEHLKQVLLSIKEDGVNVTAYTAWSLMDNFEWKDGYAVKFGLYEVDESPQRRRTARASAHYYASVVAAHSLRVPYPDHIFGDIIVEVNESEPLSSYTWLIVLAAAAVVVGAAVAFVAYRHCRRERKATEDSRPHYVTVKTTTD